MSNGVKSKVSGVAKSALPWKKGVAWWIVLIEGIVLSGLGLYMFFEKTWTMNILGWIVALSLLVSGALSVYASLKTTEKNQVRQWTMIHGVIGLVAGGIVALLLFFTILPSTRAFVLGLGCLAYGGVGLYMLIDKNLASLRRISLISTVFYILIGVLILLFAFGVDTLQTTVQLLKMVMIITGVLLIFWAFILKRETSMQEVKPTV
jgi:uncharacterized membrane protein HdeD (DUF308 family)